MQSVDKTTEEGNMQGVGCDSLLADFARTVEQVTGWGPPSYDGHPRDATHALEMMEAEIIHLNEVWGDMRRSLETKVRQLRQRVESANGGDERPAGQRP
jgi:hypothetical protein